jgi:tRNA(Leu) C34 or U34 (ribose-2'-O)-methylase TrmL
VAFPERSVLVFGPESVGFSPELRERYAERLVAIPMADRELRSLNLSTCVGIALFEVLRQRRART